MAEYALREINKPIGISRYTLGQNLPDRFRASLPTPEEFQTELAKVQEDKTDTFE